MLTAGINAALFLGEFLNKLAAIAMTASALLALTACTPQLTVEETCVELRVISEKLASSPSDEELRVAMEEVDKLSGRASDDLKQPISDVAFISLEQLKAPEDRNKDKLAEANDRMDSKGAKLVETCKL